MVAMLVLGIMIVTLYAGFASGLAVVQLARENLRATQILVKRMEDVRLYTWSQITSATNYLKPAFTTYYSPSGASKGTIYSGVVTTNTPPGLPGDYQNYMVAITVTLYWTNYPTGAGSQSKAIVHSRTMQTYVARYGMQKYVYQ